MDEAENIERVVTALLKVPEKKLRIIELVNEIPIKYGELDYTELAKRQLDVTLAIAEAKSYGTHTIMAVDSLIRLRAREEA
ncbi:MAG: hypothetical protein Q8O16_04065 [Dehalococcoidia bacterium]|nr:hypothetical protein [Dehalococcoidia bacterium]